MPVTHGRLTYLRVNNVDMSPFCDDASLTWEADTHETTTYGKSHKTRASGLKDWSMTIGGLYDSVAAGPDVTVSALVGGAAVTVEWGPEGNTVGKTRYTGTGIVSSYNPSSPVGDLVRWTATIQGSDTLTRATFP